MHLIIVCRDRSFGSFFRRHTRACVRGLTLVELLVTLGIISILASMAVGAIGGIKDHSKRLVCRNNLSQWGLATRLYTIENRGYLPPEGSSNGRSTHHAWYAELPLLLDLEPYHHMAWRTNSELDLPKSLWICPSNPRRSNGNNLFHYCMNAWVDGKGTDDLPTQLDSIPDPGKTVWMFDNGGLAPVAQHNNVYPDLHKGGAHFVFVDGQVRHLKTSEYWDSESKKGRIDNPKMIWVPK